MLAFDHFANAVSAPHYCYLTPAHPLLVSQSQVGIHRTNARPRSRQRSSSSQHHSHSWFAGRQLQAVQARHMVHRRIVPRLYVISAAASMRGVLTRWTFFSLLWRFRAERRPLSGTSVLPRASHRAFSDSQLALRVPRSSTAEPGIHLHGGALLPSDHTDRARGSEGS